MKISVTIDRFHHVTKDVVAPLLLSIIYQACERSAYNSNQKILKSNIRYSNINYSWDVFCCFRQAVLAFMELWRTWSQLPLYQQIEWYYARCSVLWSGSSSSLQNKLHILQWYNFQWLCCSYFIPKCIAESAPCPRVHAAAAQRTSKSL